MLNEVRESGKFSSDFLQILTKMLSLTNKIRFDFLQLADALKIQSFSKPITITSKIFKSINFNNLNFNAKNILKSRVLNDFDYDHNLSRQSELLL